MNRHVQAISKKLSPRSQNHRQNGRFIQHAQIDVRQATEIATERITKRYKAAFESLAKK